MSTFLELAEEILWLVAIQTLIIGTWFIFWLGKNIKNRWK